MLDFACYVLLLFFFWRTGHLLQKKGGGVLMCVCMEWASWGASRTILCPLYATFFSPGWFKHKFFNQVIPFITSFGTRSFSFAIFWYLFLLLWLYIRFQFQQIRYRKGININKSITKWLRGLEVIVDKELQEKLCFKRWKLEGNEACLKGIGIPTKLIDAKM